MAHYWHNAHWLTFARAPGRIEQTGSVLTLGPY